MLNKSSSLLNLLIVEDDQNLASSLRLMAPEGFKVFVAQKPSLIPDHVFFHAALIDLHLEVTPPDTADGLHVIQKLVKKNSQIEIVAMSGNLDRKLMEKSIHAGAQRFLAKPLSADELTLVFSKIEAYWNLRLSIYDLQKNKIKLCGKSGSTEELRKKIADLKGEKSSVLIEGETGVGKDVVAQLLNQQEGTRPFVAVNCSALTETLFESEFFGHMKGSFTGAESNKIGFAEAAHGGDLFLDEIEALPLSQQAKLLRFLESGEVRKVGAKESQHVDVRVIAAGNVPLKTLILQKKFREDLFFRLNTHCIAIAPLREHKEDIGELANYFLETEKMKRNKTFDESALDELKNYEWPGNIRELKRVCEQLVLISPLPIIRDVDVKKILNASAPDSCGVFTYEETTLDEFLKKQEKLFIEHTLNRTNNLDTACEKLKISKSNLYKKIKDLGISYE